MRRRRVDWAVQVLQVGMAFAFNEGRHPVGCFLTVLQRSGGKCRKLRSKERLRRVRRQIDRIIWMALRLFGGTRTEARAGPSLLRAETAGLELGWGQTASLARSMAWKYKR